MEHFNIQVPAEHYKKNYDSLRRFIAYYYQIDLIRKLKPKRILEIGVGNKTVSNYLKQNGYNVITCDFDKALNPEFVADIRKLPFEENAFEVVIACEILEHIPWNDVDQALKELHRVTQKYVIISIPYSCVAFEFIIKFPLIQTLIRRPLIDLFIRIPLFYKKVEFKGEHYWEMGKRRYPIRKIRAKFNKQFKIKKEIRPILNSKHYFFILEKKIKEVGE